jgi:hypothetical protein
MYVPNSLKAREAKDRVIITGLLEMVLHNN